MKLVVELSISALPSTPAAIAFYIGNCKVNFRERTSSSRHIATITVIGSAARQMLSYKCHRNNHLTRSTILREI